MTRSDFLDGLSWRTNNRLGGHAIKADVSVTIHGKDGKQKKLCFCFRSGIEELFTCEERFKFAISGCAVVFMPDKKGYMYSSTNPGGNKYAKVNFVEGDEKLVGDYSLKYEEKFGLYFIDLEEKLGE